MRECKIGYTCVSRGRCGRWTCPRIFARKKKTTPTIIQRYVRRFCRCPSDIFDYMSMFLTEKMRLVVHTLQKLWGRMAYGDSSLLFRRPTREINETIRFRQHLTSEVDILPLPKSRLWNVSTIYATKVSERPLSTFMMYSLQDSGPRRSASKRSFCCSNKRSITSIWRRR